jgi:hypothetical protein
MAAVSRRADQMHLGPSRAYAVAPADVLRSSFNRGTTLPFCTDSPKSGPFAWPDRIRTASLQSGPGLARCALHVLDVLKVLSREHVAVESALTVRAHEWIEHVEQFRAALADDRGDARAFT